MVSWNLVNAGSCNGLLPDKPLPEPMQTYCWLVLYEQKFQLKWADLCYSTDNPTIIHHYSQSPCHFSSSAISCYWLQCLLRSCEDTQTPAKWRLQPKIQSEISHTSIESKGKCSTISTLFCAKGFDNDYTSGLIYYMVLCWMFSKSELHLIVSAYKL